MLRALVFDTDEAFLPAGAAGSPLPGSTYLAGLTLLQRAVRMARKAGAEEILVFARDVGAAEEVARRERVPPTVLPADAPLPGGSPADGLLLIAAQVLGTDRLLGELVRGGGTAHAVVVAAPPGVPVLGPAYIAPSGSAEPVSPLHDNAEGDGAERKPPHRIPGSGGERPAALQVREWLSASSACRWSVPDGACRWLTTSDAIADADRSLYVGLASIADGYIDRVFNRHISGWCTRRLIRFPITPNHVTLFHGCLGLCAAALLWQGTYGSAVLGAVLFQLSVALDCTDGEIARIKYLFSKFGSRLDVGADNVVTIAVFAAIAHAAAGRLGMGVAAVLGVLSVTGVVACLLAVLGAARLQAKLRPGQASSLAVTNRLSATDQAVSAGERTLVEAVINEATSRDYSILVVLLALLGRLEWFAWLAGIGSHVFWITFSLIQFPRLRPPNASEIH